MKTSPIRSLVLPLIIVLVLGGAEFFLALPALNIQNPAFWNFLIPLLLIFTVLSLVLGTSFAAVRDSFEQTRATRRLHLNLPGPAKVGAVLCLLSFAVLVVGGLLGSPILRARSYAAQGEALITHGDFDADVPVVENGAVNDIAIMDTRTAATMGARQIGSLGTLATQYELGDFMTTTINGRILKVAPLGYGDLWKWMNRRAEGIGGYVTVDPVTGASSYTQLAEPMHYSNTGWLMDNVARKMRFAFPTAMTGNLHFEIDNSGNPYWVQTVYAHKVGLFGCPVPVGIITCDAVTGECVRYAVEEIPEWVSIAWPADDMMYLVDCAGWYGEGYLNSVFAKTGVFHTTDDYGYKQVGENLNAFTGITSAAGDESNIGFILCDMHTGSIILYDVYGAEEYSAMVAAEGLVMNYGYYASFPSLINVEGSPVYVMALTDGGNLIKKYALVDLQDYTKVAVGDTVREAWQSYVTKYEGGLPQQETPAEPLVGDEEMFTLASDPVLAVEGGNTYIYLKAESSRIYRMPVQGNEDALFMAKGWIVVVESYDSFAPGEPGVVSCALVRWSEPAPEELPAEPAEEVPTAEPADAA